VDPEMRDRPAFAILGAEVRVNPSQADFAGIWQNCFEPREAEIAPFSTDQAHYAAYFCTGQENLVDLVVGMAVEGIMEAPEGLVLRQVPAAHEAVFACTLETLSATWGRIYGEWLPASGLERDPAAPDLERFPPGFREGERAVTIHVPVR